MLFSKVDRPTMKKINVGRRTDNVSDFISNCPSFAHSVEKLEFYFHLIFRENDCNKVLFSLQFHEIFSNKIRSKFLKFSHCVIFSITQFEVTVRNVFTASCDRNLQFSKNKRLQPK